MTTALVGLVLLIAQVLRMYWDPAQWTGYADLDMFWSLPETGLILTIMISSGIALLFIAYCRPWQYGWIHSVGSKWWLFLPLAMLAGSAGGVWLPKWLAQGSDWVHLIVLGIIGMPVASELLFRSLAHGLLTQGARIQRNDTPFFISWPNVGSTLLYMGFIYLLFVLGRAGDTPPSLWKSVLSLISAGILGLTLGMVRERSQSIFPVILFHMIAAATALSIIRFL